MATPIVEYNVSTAGIALLKEKYAGLTADTPEGYQAVKEAIKDVSSYRIAVEKERVNLKAEALEYGRKVDAEAKRIQGLIAEVEEPLKAEKKKVDDEKDRIAREKVEAEKRELERLRAEEQARKEAAERAERERIRKEQEAENARLAAEREKLAKERAEQERLAAIEREKLEAERREQAAKLAAERKAIEEQQAAIRAEQAKVERERIEREAKERAEREAKERAEREKREAEEHQRQLEEARKAELAMRPDKQKLADFADTLAAIEPPEVDSPVIREHLADAMSELSYIVGNLRKAAVIKSELANA